MQKLGEISEQESTELYVIYVPFYPLCLKGKHNCVLPTSIWLVDDWFISCTSP